MRIVTADEAVSLLCDGDTLMISGSGAGHATPEALLEALERRYQAQNSPDNLRRFIRLVWVIVPFAGRRDWHTLVY